MRDAVRGRCGRRGSRLSGHRRADHHLHGQPGPAPHDPQHVQDRRRAAADRLPRVGPHRLHPGAQHLRRPFRRHGLPPDRFRDARRGQRAGGHGSVRRGAPGRHQGPRSLPELLRRLPHLPRDPEDPGVGLRRSGRDVRHGRRARLPRALPEPGAPGHARLPRERRHLLPAPRVLQLHLQRPAGRGGGVHGEGEREAGHQLPAVQLLRRPGRRPRHRGYGLHLRRGRGGHRLPQRQRREGGPREGAPVPPLRHREVRGRSARDGEEDRRARPHQGARFHRRAAVHGCRERAVR